MAARQRYRSMAIDGVVVLNKPAGLSSNAALQRVRRALRAKKAGHTGSLDPAATGMLPLCFGEATKASAYLLEAAKTYRVVARLGEATDTGDGEGKVTAKAAVPTLDESGWRRILATFAGESRQVPPMYSALRKDGQRLYDLARRGQTVERESRPIVISGIELVEIAGRRLVFRVTCSKGTYIRTLVEDIAKSADTVAHTRRLHREAVAGFEPGEMLSLGKVERLAAESSQLEYWLRPADTALRHLPAALVSGADKDRFTAGQAVPASGGEPGLVRVYGPGEQFLGVGDLGEPGIVAPKRVFNLPRSGSSEGDNEVHRAGA